MVIRAFAVPDSLLLHEFDAVCRAALTGITSASSSAFAARSWTSNPSLWATMRRYAWAVAAPGRLRSRRAARDLGYRQIRQEGLKRIDRWLQEYDPPCRVVGELAYPPSRACTRRARRLASAMNTFPRRSS